MTDVFSPGDRVLDPHDNPATVQAGPHPNGRYCIAYDHAPGQDHHFLADNLRRIEDPAGPAAPSSASTGATSTSGTGGLDGLLARLEADVRELRRLAEEVKGRHRGLWDAMLDARRRHEYQPSDTQLGYAMGWRAAHEFVTGWGPEDHELDAEMDRRYGPDRAKGGGPS